MPHAMCAGSFGAAFAKCLWRLVLFSFALNKNEQQMIELLTVISVYEVRCTHN